MLEDSFRMVEAFRGVYLKDRLADFEANLISRSGADIQRTCSSVNVNDNLLLAAARLRAASAQIDVVMHAVSILLCLPRIIEPDEIIVNLSLGAGNRGSNPDLVTTKRAAEFKLIRWTKKQDTIRQNSLFYDFLKLVWFGASAARPVVKQLYVLELDAPLKFLRGGPRGGRDLKSVFRKDSYLRDEFQKRYGDKYRKVSEFYWDHRDAVQLVDLTQVDPVFGQTLKLLPVEGAEGAFDST